MTANALGRTPEDLLLAIDEWITYASIRPIWELLRDNRLRNAPSFEQWRGAAAQFVASAPVDPSVVLIAARNLAEELPFAELAARLTIPLDPVALRRIQFGRRVIMILRDTSSLATDAAEDSGGEPWRLLKQACRHIGRVGDHPLTARASARKASRCLTALEKSRPIVGPPVGSAELRRRLLDDLAIQPADPSSNFEHFHRGRRRLRRVVNFLTLAVAAGGHDSWSELCEDGIALNKWMGDLKDARRS